jgi:glycogen(starch) synthase
MLSWEYPPVVEGGLARHVRKLSEALVAAGSEVHVLTRGAAADAREAGHEIRNGVHVHRVAEPPRPDDLDAFVAWVRAMNDHMVAAGRRLVDEIAPDLVHGHDWLVGRAASALARRAGAPFVATIHATEHGRHQGWVMDEPQATIHGLERAMARRAERVIVCSHYMRGHVADVFGLDEDRVAVIPNGIDRAELQPSGDLEELRARFAEPHERLVLLVGRLVYEKGFQLALDALGRRDGVIRRLGDVRFVVAGSGPHEAELRAQVRRLRIVRKGAFVGWIGDDVLHSLYRIADLCVVPSLYEPFGLVALEAMASGCPCIVADTGGLREVVPRDVGLRFRAGDAGVLARMMERVLVDEPLRDTLITEASEHVLRFDWGDVAASTSELYGDVLATAPGPGVASAAG